MELTLVLSILGVKCSFKSAAALSSGVLAVMHFTVAHSALTLRGSTCHLPPTAAIRVKLCTLLGEIAASLDAICVPILKPTMWAEGQDRWSMRANASVAMMLEL